MFESLSKKKDHLNIVDLLVYINYEFCRLQDNLTEIRKEIKRMAIDQATFDTDLAALITAFGTLITAVDALIASKQTDLSAEDQAVKDAAAAIASELAKLNPTPAPEPAPEPTPEPAP